MPKFIPLSRHGKNRGKYYTIVDDDKFDELIQYNWCFKGGYAYRKEGKHESVYMHRSLLNAPEGFEVKHRNKLKLDNRLANLYPVPRKHRKRVHNY
jgi:hypothetical protein